MRVDLRTFSSWIYGPGERKPLLGRQDLCIQMRDTIGIVVPHLNTPPIVFGLLWRQMVKTLVLSIITITIGNRTVGCLNSTSSLTGC